LPQIIVFCLFWKRLRKEFYIGFTSPNTGLRRRQFQERAQNIPISQFITSPFKYRNYHYTLLFQKNPQKTPTKSRQKQSPSTSRKSQPSTRKSRQKSPG
jgi:hypothetical protein